MWMNKNLWLLTIAQGLFLTNNVTFIAINGLVGLSLAPVPWMATLPVMGYVVGGALSTGLVAKSQQRFGRKGSFLLGLLVALLSAGIGAWAVMHGSFFLLVLAHWWRVITVPTVSCTVLPQLSYVRRISAKKRSLWLWPVD